MLFHTVLGHRSLIKLGCATWFNEPKKILKFIKTFWKYFFFNYGILIWLWFMATHQSLKTNKMLNMLSKINFLRPIQGKVAYIYIYINFSPHLLTHIIVHVLAQKGQKKLPFWPWFSYPLGPDVKIYASHIMSPQSNFSTSQSGTEESDYPV